MFIPEATKGCAVLEKTPYVGSFSGLLIPVSTIEVLRLGVVRWNEVCTLLRWANA